MRALQWDGQRLALNASYPQPQADSMMALVRVRLAGICSTDLQIFRGYMGFQGIPGHEYTDIVVDGPEILLGKRVVGEINFGCEKCHQCLQGLQRHCPDRRVMGILQADGCFAEYVAVPVANLHSIPDTISDIQAVFVEPLAAAYEIIEQIHVRSVDSILVIGDGKLGFLCAQVLSTTGCKVTLVGKYSHKLSLARQFGIQTLLLHNWSSQKADIVVEATGSEAGLALAMEAVRPRGTLVLKSTIATAHRLSLAPLVINEITVVGSRCGHFPPALHALEMQHIKVEPFLEAIYSLSNAIQAVEHAARPGACKIFIQME